MALEVALADSLFDPAPDLADALEAYQAAVVLREIVGDPPSDSEADSALAELMLLGNVKVAAHEQRIADDLIDEAMPLGGLFGRITTRFVEVITPDGPLDVCRDVPIPGYLAGNRYPPVLAQLARAELCELADRFDHALDGNVIGSRATCWECYDERMGFIFCFFRAFARDARYFDVPTEFLR